jgi:hypothetical protein
MKIIYINCNERDFLPIFEEFVSHDFYNSALVVASVLYWKLKGYEVEPYPTLKEAIYG